MEILHDLVVIEMNGLNGLWNNILTNWFLPIYLAAIAVFAFVFIKNQAWMKLIGFVGIAAVVGVLVFAGATFFGPNGSLTGVAEDAAGEVSFN